MRRVALFAGAVAAVTTVAGATALASKPEDGLAAPIYGIKIPQGYRNWTLISVARVGAPLNDIRAKLGNGVAISAYREQRIPFPDGSIIARLAWNQTTSEENNSVIRQEALARGLSPDAVQKLLAESFVAGSATNVQFMVKDSKKYASTGGWGFAQFTDGKPDGEAVQKTCFSCHEPAADRDFVFTRYAP